MKNSKYAKLGRVLFLLTLIFLLLAIVIQCLDFNAYVNIVLYGLAILSFTVGAILAYIAALKDKEHMKNVDLHKKDERIKNITALSKAKAFDIFTGIFAIVTAFVALNKIIDYNSIIILGLLNLLLLFLQVYYFIRLSKKM